MARPYRPCARDPYAAAVGGETDLDEMLASLSIARRPDPYTVVTVNEPVELGGGVAAVLAGYFHDHLLVPADRADDAVDALASLRETGSRA